jgi:hypothetical protein
MVLLVVIVAFSFYKYGQSTERSKEDIAEPSHLDIPEDRFFEIPTFIRRNYEIRVKDITVPESARIPVANISSANNADDVRCRFQFVCSRKWQDFESTELDDVKFCTHCEQPVYLAKTVEDFDQFAEEKKCTYWAGSKDGRGPYIDMPMMGRLVTPRSDSDYSLLDQVYRFFMAKWF